MAELLDRLRNLQSEMSKLGEKEKALNNRPDSFAAVDDRFQAAKQRLEALMARIEELSKKKRDLDGDLQTEQESLKKYQGQLMQVKNQQQYAAAWKEIDTARKKLKELEDETLKQMSEIEELEGEAKAVREELEPLETEHRSEYEAWQGSLGGLRKEAEELKAKIASIQSGLPPMVVREFQTIFKQRQGLAAVEVQNDSCGGCRVRIRPQVIQQLKRGEIAKCEGCRRFLVP